MVMTGVDALLALPLQGGLVPRGTRIEVFRQIYWVFLILGTLVGVVVIGYMVYIGYKYRDRPDRAADDDDRPTLGELPSGAGGGRKLFTSFALSTVIVVSLIAWTYGTLLFVEQDSPVQGEQGLDIEVEGYQFGWDFRYPNGATTTGTLRVPVDTPIQVHVTSRDVFHNFGIPALRVKSDAIPGQTTSSWFVANETGRYTAKCYEVCGTGHSYMNADVVVMEHEAYEEWYDDLETPTPTPEPTETHHEGAGGEGESGGEHA